MDYLFLHRDKRTFTSEKQKNLLFRAARLYWEQKYADNEVVPKRKVDCELYLKSATIIQYTIKGRFMSR